MARRRMELGCPMPGLSGRGLQGYCACVASKSELLHPEDHVPFRVGPPAPGDPKMSPGLQADMPLASEQGDPFFRLAGLGKGAELFQDGRPARATRPARSQQIPAVARRLTLKEHSLLS